MKNALYLSLTLVLGALAVNLAARHDISSLHAATSAGSGEMPASSHLGSIVLGAGCFWGFEKRYSAIPGVIDAVSGYADGRGHPPVYTEIIKRKHRSNPDNYAEVVKVTFNTSAVTLEQILKNYFEGHDPTQLNRQGNDIGTQYRSTILTNSEEQQQLAHRIKREYQALLTRAGFGTIVTKIKPLDEFHRAEEYHQNYLVKNPDGYCPDHSTGVTFGDGNADEPMDNSALTQGRQIVIIDAEHCPYCERFKADVANQYQGAIPMSFRLASQLEGLDIETPTWATPTILFLENGKEIFSHQGYMAPHDFYRALGHFQLGDSEAFKVAFNHDTDAPFCKQYDEFKNTPDGVFVDKLSGRPLFDTRDRFNSGSGWLSFTRAVEDSVTEHQDLSYGMNRTEVRSKASGIHLGHVFEDGPDGQPRYCINATVLEFRARDSADTDS